MNKTNRIVSIILLISIIMTSFSTISTAVTTVGDYTYSGYAGRDEVGLGNYTGNEKELTIPSTIDGKTVFALETNLLKDNENVTKVIIPEGITEIQDRTFNSCPNLEEIVLPSSIEYLSYNWVYDCPNVTYTIPDTLTKTDEDSYKKVVTATIKSGTYDYDKALKMIEYANLHREENGLEPLEVDNELMEYAMKRAKELSIFYDHYRALTGRSAIKSENIGSSSSSMLPDYLVQQWIESPMHENAMLRESDKSTGMGCFYVNGRCYFIQVFSGSEATNSTTKTGKIEVTNEKVEISAVDGYIEGVISGLETELSIGETTSPTRVSLRNHSDKVSASTEINASDFTWNSSDNKVFTVDETGTVKAVGKGTATLTATLGDFSTEFTIEVKDVPVTGIELDEEDKAITINIGDKRILYPTVLPEDASNKEIEWTTSDDKIATVGDDGTITGISKGTAEITATTVNGNYSVSCQVTVNCNHKNTTTHEAVDSTCLVQGNAEYITCNDCGEIVSGSDEKLPLADHKYGNLIERVEPTHTSTTLADGMEAHYQCSVCNKLFNENKEEVTEEDLIIKAPLHTYGDWVADTTYHWKECGCGNIIEQAEHTGGEATCINKAICEVCNLEYGELDSTNHKNTETRNDKEASCSEEGYTGDTYCTDCDTLLKQGTTIAKTEHTGGEATCVDKAVCEICGEEYGEINSNNHKNTEIRNKKEASCSEEGYTGDTYCTDCDTLLKQGTTIAKTEHTGGEATCVDKAVCEICGEEYGEINSNNHKNTEIRNKKEASCSEEGYTGDTYCVDCGTLIEKGTAIPKTDHRGGEATCVNKAVCEVCGQEYGEINSTNHKNTKTRNAVEVTCTTDGYTGDTYCADCDTKLEDGEVIKAEGHKGGEATCIAKAKCEVCGTEYGEIDSTNHKNTEMINEKEVTCTEDGYTGDTYCNDCDKVVENGKTITATGHKGGEATCVSKAKCEVCGLEYGEIDATNHKNTETRNAVEATTETEGYTGDVYCIDCDELVKEGEVIPVITTDPEEPTDDEKEEVKPVKDEEETTDGTKPQTDDNSNMTLWISLLVISGISFVAIARCNTKRKVSKHSK